MAASGYTSGLNAASRRAECGSELAPESGSDLTESDPNPTWGGPNLARKQRESGALAVLMRP